MAVLGIDLGTSSVKISLADQNGQLIQSSKREYSLDQPQEGYKEIDPDRWIEAIQDCLLQDFTKSQRNTIQAIGVTGQMHTLIVLGEQGRPLRKALMWNDLRAKDQADRLKTLLDQKEAARKPGKNPSGITSILSAGSPAAALLWMKENESDLYRKITKILIAPDYVVYRLTGQAVSDYCDMSTSSLLDYKSAKPSIDMLEILDLDLSVLPEITGIEQQAWPITKEAADYFDLPENCLVLTATGDNSASALGLNLFEERKPILSIGTSGVIMACRDHPDFDHPGKNILFSLDGKTMLTMVQGSLASGGSALNWWVQNILNADFGQVLNQADPDHLDTGSLIFCPYLNGDKYVYPNSGLQGTFYGLTARTDALQMALAVIEGVAFGLRTLAREMDIDLKIYESIEVTGGGSRSDIWMQMLANVLQVPLKAGKSASSAAEGVMQSALRVLHKERKDRIDGCAQFETGCQRIEHSKEPTEKIYQPACLPELEKKYQRFLNLMEMSVVFNQNNE